MKKEILFEISPDIIWDPVLMMVCERVFVWANEQGLNGKIVKNLEFKVQDSPNKFFVENAYVTYEV